MSPWLHSQATLLLSLEIFWTLSKTFCERPYVLPAPPEPPPINTGTSTEFAALLMMFAIAECLEPPFL